MFSNRKNKKRSSNTFGRIESLETRELMCGADCLAAAPVAADVEDIAKVHVIVAPAPASHTVEEEPAKAKKEDRWSEIVDIIDKGLEELTEWTIKT